jgi:hypothetical protein
MSKLMALDAFGFEGLIDLESVVVNITTPQHPSESKESVGALPFFSGRWQQPC